MRNFDKPILECFKELYLKATPSADFEKLMSEAPLNSRGQKEIKFNDYTISQQNLDDVINNTIKKFRIPKRYRQAFKNTIYLGPSPKTLKTD